MLVVHPSNLSSRALQVHIQVWQPLILAINCRMFLLNQSPAQGTLANHPLCFPWRGIWVILEFQVVLECIFISKNSFGSKWQTSYSNQLGPQRGCTVFYDRRGQWGWWRAMFIEHIHCAWHCSKHFININLCNIYNNSVKEKLLLFPLKSQGNREQRGAGTLPTPHREYDVDLGLQPTRPLQSSLQGPLQGKAGSRCLR